MDTLKGNTGAVAQRFLNAQTIDVASIGAGLTVETAVSIPGAEVGDIVVGVPRTQLVTGIVYNNCRVSAANTVQLALTNITAGAIDPASNVWDFVVNKP